MPKPTAPASLATRLLFALTLAVTLCGCSGGGSSSPPTEPPVTSTCSAGQAAQWPGACNTPVVECVAGAWDVLAVGGMPAVRYQTAHFAMRWAASDVTDAQAQAAGATLEMVWSTFMGKVGFTEPYCDTAAKHKVNIHIDPTFGLTGGSTGGRDMGMWIGPGALADHWGLAHEFTHALQVSTLGLRDSPYASWVFESHANWMAHQLDEYRDNTHCSVLLVDSPHLYYGSTRDRYCNWQFWEFVKDRFCYQAVNAIWTTAIKQGETGHETEDPMSVLARHMGWSASQLNDQFGDWAMHNANWDYRDPDGTDRGPGYRASYVDSAPDAVGDRARRLTRLDVLDAPARRYAVPPSWAPQRWGYNMVQLHPDAGAESITVDFRGVVQAAAASTAFGSLTNDPATVPAPDSDWRWGLVAVDAAGKSRYSSLQRGASGTASLCLQAGDQSLWLAVVATPSKIQQIKWDQNHASIYRYPWMVQITGAQPDGFQANAPAPSAAGHRHANGGGWVADEATVAATAYIGPQAVVLGGSVLGRARLEDHALLLSGTLKDDAVVGGISVISADTVVGGSAHVSTSFRAIGAFESGIALSGTAWLYGDVEQRGQSFASGAYTGLVDADAVGNAAFGAGLAAPPAEVTAVPDYTWRP
jgi:Family of unknown function (DUF6055)